MLCLLNVEDQIPRDHPLRSIKEMSDEALRSLSRTFSRMYSRRGRPSIPPERLLKGMLLMALYSIRSEVQFCEQLRYNLLYRWFLDMDMVEKPFDHCAFSDNRERLLAHDVAAKFFRAVTNEAERAGLMSDDHFSVDGTLIEAWASMKSFRPKDDDDDEGDSNRWSDFRGKKRRNDTHESKTDPESRLMRKGRGKEAKLCFAGHALMENRHGLIKDLRLTQASGRCEREAALDMLKANKLHGVTLGADAGYNTAEFVEACEQLKVEPHVADTAHYLPSMLYKERYRISQTVRKRVEQIFGWAKTCGGLRKTRFRGRAKNSLLLHMTGAAYNLLRISKLRHRLA